MRRTAAYEGRSMTSPRNRGRIVRGLIVAALASLHQLGAAGTATAQAPDCAGRGVPTSKISIQLWTFAEYVGFGTDAATIARLEEVLSRLSEMGYRNVEPFTLSGLTAEQYRALLDKYGLKASARHVDVGTPQNPADIEQILAENRTLGIKFFGSGGTPNLRHRGRVDRVRRVPERARRAGAPGRADADGAQPRLGVRARLRRPDGVRHPDGAHRPAERRLPARPVLGDERRRHREPGRACSSATATGSSCST